MVTEKFQQIISQTDLVRTICQTISSVQVLPMPRPALYPSRESSPKVERAWTLNATKCQKNVPELTYIGHVLMSRGLHVSDKKVKAIVNAPLPKDRSEV